MPDFRFNCPECDQELEAPEDMAGETVECPSCEIQFAVPVAEVTAPEVSHPGVSAEENADMDESDSACPSCGVEMPADAVLCVHCGYNIKLGKKIGTSFE